MAIARHVITRLAETKRIIDPHYGHKKRRCSVRVWTNV
jgi:hypothetical protein